MTNWMASPLRRQSGMRIHALALVFAAATLAGCGAGMAPSASVTTANPVWQSYFKVDYSVATKGERRMVDGYVNNTYGAPMGGVQLLVQALDAGDNVVAQRLVQVPGIIGPFGRSYFSVGNLPATEQYRVTVWAFDRIESPTFP